MPQPLRAYLEAQADRVEMILSSHKAPGRVTGGTVGPRLVRFFLDPAADVRYEKIRRLADDLALALHVNLLTVDRSEKGVVLEFENPNPRPVSLLNLLPQVVKDEHGAPDPLPNTTALLGLTDDGLPLLARLASEQVAHLLIVGMTGSGKSVLLRTIALSLLLTHTPNKLRMILLDPKGKTFEPFAGAPQLLRSPVTEAPEALETFRSLQHLIVARDRHGESSPCVTVLIDELGELLFSGGDQIAEGLTRLVQRGREVGIHLVAATQRPSSAIMTDLMKVNFPLRLVGKVVSANDARLATGRGGTDAHLLQGRGDFLAIGGGEGDPLRFQAAYVGEREIASALAKYQREPHAYSPSMSKAEYEARQQKKSPATQPQSQPEPLMNVTGTQQLRR